MEPSDPSSRHLAVDALEPGWAPAGGDQHAGPGLAAGPRWNDGSTADPNSSHSISI